MLQFAFSMLALLVALPLTLGFILMALGEFLLPASIPATPVDALSLLLLAASAGFVCLLLLPSAWFSLQNLIGRREVALAAQPPARSPWVWFLPLPLVILGGYGVTLAGEPWVYLLPLLHVAAVGLTAAFLYALGSRGLSLGSRQRFWGVLGSGLVLGPLLILLAELFFLVLFGVAAVLTLSANPELLERLLLVLETIPDSPQAAEELFALLEPYLANPVVLFAILAFAAGIVPLVEEAFKPIGVWLLFNRRLTPVAGFVGGLLSGAAYGMFESLSLTMTGEAWAAVVITRAGTTLLHIFTAGLVGWGLALAFKHSRFLNLLLGYLAAVLLHGLWNGLTLFSTLSELEILNLPADHPVLVLSRLAPFGLVGLVLVIFIALLLLNGRFRRQLPEQDQVEYNEPPAQLEPNPPVQPGVVPDKETYGTDQPVD
jgi:hypothetical protein